MNIKTISANSLNLSTGVPGQIRAPKNTPLKSLQKGASALEYIVLVGAVAVVLAGAVAIFGDEIGPFFQSLLTPIFGA